MRIFRRRRGFTAGIAACFCFVIVMACKDVSDALSRLGKPEETVVPKQGRIHSERESNSECPRILASSYLAPGLPGE